MACAIVGQVCDVQRSLSGKLAILKFEARILEKRDRLVDSRILNFLRIVAVAYREFISAVLFECAAVAVSHSCRDVGSCNLLACLADCLYNVRTVDEDRESLSHSDSLVNSLAFEDRAVYVERRIVGSQVVDNVEIRVVHDRSDLVCGNCVSEVKVAGVVS